MHLEYIQKACYALDFPETVQFLQELSAVSSSAVAY